MLEIVEPIKLNTPVRITEDFVLKTGLNDVTLKNGHLGQYRSCRRDGEVFIAFKDLTADDGEEKYLMPVWVDEKIVSFNT